MLKYRINKNSVKCIHQEIKNPEVYAHGDLDICVNTENFTNIHKGDDIVFKRTQGNDVNFYELKRAKEVSKNGEELKVTVEEFPDLVLNVKGVGEKNISYYRDKNEKNTYMDYLYFFIDDDKKHFLYESRDIVISEFLRENYPVKEQDSSDGKRCNGDNVLYNDMFLYKATVNEKGNYVLDKKNILNKKDGVILIIPNQQFKNDIKEYSGKHWKYEDDILYLKDCITPLDFNGKDDRTLLLWPNEDKNLSKLIKENASFLRYYTKDERFIVRTDKSSSKGLKCDIQPETIIAKMEYSIHISNVIEENFNTNLIQEEQLKDYAKKIAEENKNEIIDYEKQIFEPVIYSGESIVNDANEIKFILNFRERPSSVTEMEGVYNVVDYGEWKTNDSMAWNYYSVKEGKIEPKNEEKKSDLLGYLGFTDEDVYYRKKKIGKSFLRLSFFDTQSRATQSLLFTSTIFLKEGELYSNYIKNLRNNKTPDDRGFVFTENEYRIDCSNSCKSKFRNEISTNNNSNYSSEGFYLYLFPNILKDNEATIYMKVEFNHAKYGYTIPFIMPMSDGVVIDPHTAAGREIFPVDYVEGTGDTEYVNTNKLFQDMYIPIKLKYDSTNNKYTWGVEAAQNNIDNNILFHLFEPIINKLKVKKEENE